MYLVMMPCAPDSVPTFAFFHADPRLQGCRYPVVEANFEDFFPRLDEWSSGPMVPAVLARSKRAPGKFRVFLTELDVPLSWEIVEGRAVVYATWEQMGLATPV